MNVPAANYDPYEQYMGKSSVDLSENLEDRNAQTNEELRRSAILQARRFPHRRGQAATDRPFEFVPAEQVKKLQQRVDAARRGNRSHGQHMGFSNIFIGDDGGEVNSYSHKPVRATVQRIYDNHGQHHGAESSSQEGQQERVQQRSYPGGHSLTKANVSNTCVPPAFPHPKVKTKMGEEHMDSCFVPPQYDHPRVLTQMGDETSGNVQYKKPEDFGKTQFLKETDTESLSSGASGYGFDDPEGPQWLAAEMDKPLPMPPPRRSYPGGHHINKSNVGAANGHIGSLGAERQPTVIKAVYPGGHQLVKSNIGPNLGQSEPINSGVRGSYSHGQRFGKSSVSFNGYGKNEGSRIDQEDNGADTASVYSTTSSQHRRQGRMGESSMSAGGLVAGGAHPPARRRHSSMRAQHAQEDSLETTD